MGDKRDTPLDFPSVILSVLAFGGLVYAVSSLENILEGEGLIDILVLAIGLVALALFTLRQVRLAKDNRALLDMRPFKVPNFTVAVLGMLLMFGLLLGVVNVLPIYLQTLFGGKFPGHRARRHARRLAARRHLPDGRPPL